MNSIIQKTCIASCILFFISLLSFSQTPGEWTWMGGDSLTNQPPVYGTQGVPGPLNHPPGVYEACEWTDLQGNFWIYGGMTGIFGQFGDLWKYDPVINQWAWVNGPGIPDQLPVFGIKGVAAAGNYPGARSWGVCTWTDLNGNLWMFGNYKNTMGTMADLWMYNISSNMWTWMSGQNGFNYLGNYGIQGIPSPTNSPPGINETSVAWIDSLNNLWFFGGGDIVPVLHDDVWKYSVSTNEWTWMKGAGSAGATPVYGIKGISNPANTPGGRMVYGRWKENNDNFWLFGGWDGLSQRRNDMWRYTVSTNEWTWLAGPTTVNDTGRTIDTLCHYSSLNLPASVYENRACWKDSKSNFVMHSGFGANGVNNIMWSFNRASYKFAIIHRETYAPFYGTKGISSPANSPGGRGGACSFTDQNNYLWMFGGTSNLGYSCDVWRFVPDTNCGQNLFPNTCFYPFDDSICPGTCTDFTNCSFGATGYSWTFPGASPDTSTVQNPSGICYSTPGTYDVTLIGTNAAGSSVYTCANCITVFPSPPPQGILQSGDTLFANPGAVSYQWYYNGNIISGATGYFYVAPQSGDYNVVATDANGCEVEAVIFNVLASAQFAIGSGQLAIFPNPVEDKITIHNALPMAIGITSETAMEISVYNMIGEKVLAVYRSTALSPLSSELDVRTLPSGMYWIEVSGGNKTSRAKFIKE